MLNFPNQKIQTRTNAPSLDNLPTEMLHMIILNLPPSDIFTLMRCSKGYSVVVEDVYLLEKIYHKNRTIIQTELSRLLHEEMTARSKPMRQNRPKSHLYFNPGRLAYHAVKLIFKQALCDICFNSFAFSSGFSLTNIANFFLRSVPPGFLSNLIMSVVAAFAMSYLMPFTLQLSPIGALIGRYGLDSFVPFLVLLPSTSLVLLSSIVVIGINYILMAVAFCSDTINIINEYAREMDLLMHGDFKTDARHEYKLFLQTLNMCGELNPDPDQATSRPILRRA